MQEESHQSMISACIAASSNTRDVILEHDSCSGLKGLPVAHPHTHHGNHLHAQVRLDLACAVPTSSCLCVLNSKGRGFTNCTCLLVCWTQMLRMTIVGKHLLVSCLIDLSSCQERGGHM